MLHKCLNWHETACFPGGWQGPHSVTGDQKKKLPNEGKTYHNLPSAESRIIVIYGRGLLLIHGPGLFLIHGRGLFPISVSIRIWAEERMTFFRLLVSTEWVDNRELRLLMAFGEFKTKLEEFFFMFIRRDFSPGTTFFRLHQTQRSDSQNTYRRAHKVHWLCQGLSEHTFVRVLFWWLRTYFHTGHMANSVNPRNQRAGAFLSWPAKCSAGSHPGYAVCVDHQPDYFLQWDI